MTTTTVANNQTVTNQDVTSGNELDILSGGTANSTTVETGGNQTVEAGGTETGALVKAGGTEVVNGTINASNVPTSSGTASGDDDFGTINVGSGGVISNVTVENGGTLNLTAKSALANGVTVLSGGALTINGNAPANNVTLQGGTLELESAKADSTNTTAGVPTASGNLTFASGVNSRLQIDVAQSGGNGTTFAQPIAGFAAGDVIDLKFLNTAGVTITQAASGTNGANTTVTVSGTLAGTTTSASETFTFLNTTPGSFATAADPTAGGVDLVETACYASGTLIRAARGTEIVDVAVEHLVVGDLVVTASGVVRPIAWLGQRTVNCRAHPRPLEAYPIRIAADAFAPDRPSRDLYVSPGHAVCVDMMGEVLIPAAALVNGSTIAQVEVDEVTYWHIELEAHDILLAENLPAESYLDTGNRDFFAGGDVIAMTAAPDADPARRRDATCCRTFVADGPLVAAARHCLRAGAQAAGWTLVDDTFAGLHLMVDGQRIEPKVNGLAARFVVPASAKSAWLVSSTSVPRDVIAGNDDPRRLGVAITRLAVDDGIGVRREIDPADPRLAVGFYPCEGQHRWTAGRALLPCDLWDGCEGHFFLRVEIAFAALPRWAAPCDAAEIEDDRQFA